MQNISKAATCEPLVYYSTREVVRGGERGVKTASHSVEGGNESGRYFTIRSTINLVAAPYTLVLVPPSPAVM